MSQNKSLEGPKWYKIFSSEEEAQALFAQKQSILIKIKDLNLCMSKYEGNYYASENQCPHNGEKLHNGWINYKGEIVCPWHNYRFQLKTGRECQERTGDLRVFEVKHDKEGIFIQC